MLPLHHARGGRRIPVGLPLLLVAVILTLASAQEGTRLLRSYRQARYERTSAELQADRPAGEPEVWASGRVYEKNLTLIEQLQSLLSKDEVSQLHSLCQRCLWHTLQTCVRAHGIGRTTYVATGDIDEMWLRDSAVQAAIYFSRVEQHPSLRILLEGVIRTHAYFVLQDPYANSFRPRWQKSEEWKSKQLRGLGRAGFVGTRNYELDSGAYFIGLLWNFAVTPGIRRPGTLLRQPLVHDAVELQLRTWALERWHEENSTYRYAELPRGGIGPQSSYTGMVWSGFRPSDDRNTYGFNIPGNMYAWAALQRARALNAQYWQDDSLETLALDLSTTIREGIEEHGVIATEDGELVYAYEVDGLGNSLSDTDDPNVPSLLAAPLLGYTPLDAAVFQTTHRRLLSADENPFYFAGPDKEGLGSTHTPHNYVWPLSWMVEALTSGNATRRAQLLRWTLASQCGNGLMHESIDVTDPSGGRCTRPWFEWANALLVVMVENTLGLDCGRPDASEARVFANPKMGAGAGSVADFVSLEAAIKHLWIDKTHGEGFGEGWDVPIQQPG